MVKGCLYLKKRWLLITNGYFYDCQVPTLSSLFVHYKVCILTFVTKPMWFEDVKNIYFVKLLIKKKKINSIKINLLEYAVHIYTFYIIYGG